MDELWVKEKQVPGFHFKIDPVVLPFHFLDTEVTDIEMLPIRVLMFHEISFMTTRDDLEATIFPSDFFQRGGCPHDQISGTEGEVQKVLMKWMTSIYTGRLVDQHGVNHVKIRPKQTFHQVEQSRVL